MTAVVETFTRLLNIADVDIDPIVVDVDVFVGDPDIFLLTLLMLMLAMIFLQLLPQDGITAVIAIDREAVKTT